MRDRAAVPPPPPAPVRVRVVRGVWWQGRGYPPGAELEVSPVDAKVLEAAGKVVALVAVALPPQVTVIDPAAAVPVTAREPIRRVRR